VTKWALPLKINEQSILEKLPQAKILPINATYNEAIDGFKFNDSETNLVLFLGSNLGNLYHNKAIKFLAKIKKKLGENDYLLMGLDKMKDPAIILDAYNDKEGITRDFNLNLLTRMNNELGANFDISKFSHWPIYNPQSGTCTSYIISKEEQEIYFSVLEKTFSFEKSESIHTEISQKYNETSIEWLCKMSGLAIDRVYTDTNDMFYECLIKKNK
jgi:L-histidine N-alpha-methyltransferase